MGKVLLLFEVETINSFTHALGIVFGFIFIPSLISFSLQHGTTAQTIGVSVYGICYLITFTLSTLYHAMKRAKIKQRLELLDHISIYFLIAATYTPFVIYYMFNSTGITLLLIVWCFVVTGIFFKLYYLNKFILLSVVSYVSMSVLFLFVRESFFKNMPAEVITLIYSGIALYMLGIIFFLWRRLKHHHALWHLFVLAASICHYQAVWISVKN
jgi:hemolysin III